jgi:hypothetical protein
VTGVQTCALPISKECDEEPGSNSPGSFHAYWASANP